MKKYLTVLLLIIFVSACSPTKQWRKGLEGKWLGKTKDELITKRGEPYQIDSGRIKGIAIYIYHRADFTPDIPPNDYYEEFLTKDKGIVYKIKTYSR